MRPFLSGGSAQSLPFRAMQTLKPLQYVTCGVLLLLIANGIATELWLAPLRPGGSWLVLKVLPLLAALPGLLHARRYTFQWLSLLVWIYFALGAVNAASGQGNSVPLGYIEATLALGLFVCCALYARRSAPSRLRQEG